MASKPKRDGWSSGASRLCLCSRETGGVVKPRSHEGHEAVADPRARPGQEEVEKAEKRLASHGPRRKADQPVLHQREPARPPVAQPVSFSLPALASLAPWRSPSAFRSQTAACTSNAIEKSAGLSDVRGST